MATPSPPPKAPRAAADNPKNVPPQAPAAPGSPPRGNSTAPTKNPIAPQAIAKRSLLRGDTVRGRAYSTVTLFARFRGLSTSVPLMTAV